MSTFDVSPLEMEAADKAAADQVAAILSGETDIAHLTALFDTGLRISGIDKHGNHQPINSALGTTDALKFGRETRRRSRMAEYETSAVAVDADADDAKHEVTMEREGHAREANDKEREAMALRAGRSPSWRRRRAMSISYPSEKVEEGDTHEGSTASASASASAPAEGAKGSGNLAMFRNAQMVGRQLFTTAHLREDVLWKNAHKQHIAFAAGAYMSAVYSGNGSINLSQDIHQFIGRSHTGVLYVSCATNASPPMLHETDAMKIMRTGLLKEAASQPSFGLCGFILQSAGHPTELIAFADNTRRRCLSLKTHINVCAVGITSSGERMFSPFPCRATNWSLPAAPRPEGEVATSGPFIYTQLWSDACMEKLSEMHKLRTDVSMKTAVVRAFLVPHKNSTYTQQFAVLVTLQENAKSAHLPWFVVAHVLLVQPTYHARIAEHIAIKRHKKRLSSSRTRNSHMASSGRKRKVSAGTSGHEHGGDTTVLATKCNRLIELVDANIRTWAPVCVVPESVASQSISTAIPVDADAAASPEGAKAPSSSIRIEAAASMSRDQALAEVALDRALFACAAEKPASSSSSS